MKVYQVSYSSEECERHYGLFSSEEKAVERKQFILDKISDDENMVNFYNRELYIMEHKIDEPVNDYPL